ncbi:MAG TPA: acetylornithine/succinylornithine family transaminase, partial [Xanthobacteraceae bacterium]|nr:acetylornithine/succinylornithine family transaminase [Xanthobacteraceae bacterium]
MNTYQRPPQVFTHGRGCYVYDQNGRAYLDFLGGIAVNALGHAHPRLVRVIRREAGRAIHQSNLFHNPFQGPLAAKLAKWSGLDRVFFTNSGGEAIEGALKLARLVTRKRNEGAAQPPAKLLALENSFHGRTAGALSLTATLKYREPFAPLLPNVEFVRFNDVTDLESKFDASVCALFLETIQGEGGIHPVSEEFYRRARELATRHGAALVADEIQCGLGRTGRAFAFQKFGKSRELAPDIVAIAKPLAGGLPLGAFLASEEFASTIAPGLHGTTFGGGPLVCAAALEFLTVVEEEYLMANVRARGVEIRAALEALKSKFNFIREVRGEGLMLGVELDLAGAPYIEQALARGLIINCAHEHTLRLLP